MSLCNKDAKSIQHIIWVKCDKWAGLFLVTSNNVASHFLSFYLTGLSAQVNRVWRVMWLALTKAIWMHRNRVIFKGCQVDEVEIFLQPNCKFGVGQDLWGLGFKKHLQNGVCTLLTA